MPQSRILTHTHLLPQSIAIAISWAFTTPSTEFTNVSFPSNDNSIQLHAYLKTPPGLNATSPAVPGVVVLHDWNGMSKDVQWMVRG